MPHLPKGNGAPQQNTAPQGHTRRGQSLTQSYDGRRSGCWNHLAPSGINASITADSRRAYANAQTSVPSSIAGQVPSHVRFDTHGQIFEVQSYGGQDLTQPQYWPQTAPYASRNNTWYRDRIALPIRIQQQWVVNPTLRYSSVNMPQPAQSRTDAAPTYLRQYPAARILQQYHQPAPGSWRAPQTSFRQPVPIHPQRCIEKSHSYSTSREQPMPSTEHSQPSRNVPPYGNEQIQRSNGRQSTPQQNPTAVPQPPAPYATRVYLLQAHLPPEKLKKPKRLLVILDLNGTLMLKPDYRKPNNIHVRPGAQKLLDYLFAEHFVMVYTSGQPHNAELIARHLFSEAQYDKLAAIWARNKLDLTPEQYRAKVQVYKKLDKIWANNEIQSSFFPPGSGKWDQSNTILVDDSHLKALQEPHNLLQVTEFTGKPSGSMKKKAYDEYEAQICQSLVIKLEALRWQKDVSRLIWRWQTGKADIPKVPGSNFFVDEKVDQGVQARKALEAAMNLPIPCSPASTDDEEESFVGADGVAVLPQEDLEALVTPERKRSQSPVDEAVFRDLLAGGVHSEAPQASTVRQQRKDRRAKGMGG